MQRHNGMNLIKFILVGLSLLLAKLPGLTSHIFTVQISLFVSIPTLKVTATWNNVGKGKSEVRGPWYIKGSETVLHIADTSYVSMQTNYKVIYVMEGLHPLSPGHFAWQLSARISPNLQTCYSVTWSQLLRNQTNTGTSRSWRRHGVIPVIVKNSIEFATIFKCLSRYYNLRLYKQNTLHN